jgi:hypothetical protein
MSNHVQIVSHSKQQARATLVLPLAPMETGVEPNEGGIVQHAGRVVQLSSNDAPVHHKGEFDSLEDLLPREGDYVYPVFRALSAAVIPGYWLDYSRPGVLEASTQMLNGQTVYKNHAFRDVEQWLGAVNSATWDAEGAQTGGVPGINVELKLDWRMNPRIARGLLMRPPAIHSASVTVLFEYVYSHQDLADQKRFWDLLGEEVDGEVVRLIVTKILGHWEISLVFQGADQLAKQMSAEQVMNEPEKEMTLKLAPELLARLGIENGEYDSVSAEEMFLAVNRLATAADEGRAMAESLRSETLRLARLSEGVDGSLAEPIEELFKTANVKQLATMKRLYEERVAKRFPHTCQSCGEASSTVRSSVEVWDEEFGLVMSGVAESLH